MMALKAKQDEIILLYAQRQKEIEIIKEKIRILKLIEEQLLLDDSDKTVSAEKENLVKFYDAMMGVFYDAATMYSRANVNDVLLQHYMGNEDVRELVQKIHYRQQERDRVFNKPFSNEDVLLILTNLTGEFIGSESEGGGDGGSSGDSQGSENSMLMEADGGRFFNHIAHEFRNDFMLNGFTDAGQIAHSILNNYSLTEESCDVYLVNLIKIANKLAKIQQEASTKQKFVDKITKYIDNNRIAKKAEPIKSYITQEDLIKLGSQIKAVANNRIVLTNPLDKICIIKHDDKVHITIKIKGKNDSYDLFANKSNIRQFMNSEKLARDVLSQNSKLMKNVAIEAVKTMPMNSVSSRVKI